MLNCNCRNFKNCNSCNDSRPKNKCDEPYRCINCYNKQQKLNISPPVCLLSSNTYKSLYDKLYDGILQNNLEILYDNLIKSDNPGVYTAFLDKIVEIYGITIGSPSPRIVLTESDGTVVIDTSSTNNTYDNWINGTINESHNSRVAILATQLFECGVGYETKFSNSVGTDQAYIGIRLGNYLNNPGSIRISQNI